ncbi:GNAT family N-acetyltransferase [Blastococcus deserti]|uniref:GNAT family N-acetyltransferase n=1 Tax=Blastococcus deserti TaxID=2259033 RepID=A0ABW4X7Z2_9ACTN
MSTVLSPAPVAPGAGEVHLRPMRPDDTAEAARIMFEAFAGIADRHGFPRDFTPESARQLVDAFQPHPSIWAVVAERDGRVVGSNFLDVRSPVAGVGPITVDPDAQASGVGRLLMGAVLDRAAATPGTEGVRLLQDSFNTASLALYASLGFVATDPVALMGGRPTTAPFPRVEVRPLTEEDVDACARLHQAVHGYERTAELRDAMAAPHLQPLVAVRAGRVVAYATTLHAFGAAHAVAETEDDLAALIAGGLAATDAEASFLLPVRQHILFRWCLAAGLRVIKPMTYMAYGPYRRPEGAWLPSVLS